MNTKNQPLFTVCLNCVQLYIHTFLPILCTHNNLCKSTIENSQKFKVLVTKLLNYEFLKL